MVLCVPLVGNCTQVERLDHEVRSTSVRPSHCERLTFAAEKVTDSSPTRESNAISRGHLAPFDSGCSKCPGRTLEQTKLDGWFASPSATQRVHPDTACPRLHWSGLNSSPGLLAKPTGCVTLMQ